jgi:hypothetical protein
MVAVANEAAAAADAMHFIQSVRPPRKKHLHDGTVDHLHSEEDGIHGGVNQPKIR